MRAFLLRMAAVVAVIGVGLLFQALISGNLALLGGVMLLPAALMGAGWLLRQSAKSRRRARRARQTAAHRALPVRAAAGQAVAVPVKRPPLYFPPNGPKAA